MARNRLTEDREVKQAAIVDTAAELFIRDGYDATSMAALAKAAGVTPNTIYWYFDDKDAVLIAVMTQLLRAARTDVHLHLLPTLTDRLLWLVEMFDRLSSLTVAIHARAETSPAVEAWHERFHAAGDATLIGEMRAHLQARGNAVPPPGQLAALARLWTYAIEGMVAHETSAESRRALCELLVRQLESAAVAH